ALSLDVSKLAQALAELFHENLRVGISERQDGNPWRSALRHGGAWPNHCRAEQRGEFASSHQLAPVKDKVGITRFQRTSRGNCAHAGAFNQRNNLLFASSAACSIVMNPAPSLASLSTRSSSASMR